MTTASVPASGTSKARVGVQRFGTFLSGMIMPNIPALIAWGIFTAFFIGVGWTPNADLATIVGPFIHYLLPLLIAYTGGSIIYGIRGGVVASIATMGAIAGSDLLIAQINADLPADNQLGQVHMFIGAMIMAPIAAYSMKWLDSLWEGKIKAGFEMLVNMFSAGIWGFVMAIVGFYPIAWLVNGIMQVLSNAVNWLVDYNLLPLTSIIIEPAKVLLPQQRHQPRRADAARRLGGRRHRLLDPVPARGEPRTGCRPAARVHVLRPRRRTRLGAGRGRDPVLRRHPRGVLPVRADEADPDPRPHRRRHDRRHHQHAAGRCAARAGGPGQHHRGARTDRAGRVLRGDPVGRPVGCRHVPDRRPHPAGLAQARPRRDGGDRRRLRRRDHADRGGQGQVLRRPRRGCVAAPRPESRAASSRRR